MRVAIYSIKCSLAFVSSDAMKERKMRRLKKDSARKTKNAPTSSPPQAMKMERILGSLSWKGTSALSSASFFFATRTGFGAV
jgi:hypothetical protein